jgi:hypothetical protein
MTPSTPPFRLAICGRISLIAALTALWGCFDQPVAPVDQTDGEVAVTNDSSTLAQRVTYSDTPIPIDPVESSSSADRTLPILSQRRQEVDLRLRARVEPPLVGETRVQATSVAAKSGANFVVSYNTRGALRRGGIDWLVGGNRPRVKSSVAFRDADVSAVELTGNRVFAAQAVDPDGTESPAAVERLKRTQLAVSLNDHRRTSLPSFAATSVLSANGLLYVTTGSDGGLFALDPAELEVVARAELDDARWVTRDPATGNLVVAQGTPGRITLVDPEPSGGTLRVLRTYAVPGANVPESKTTVEVAGGKAFVAGGPEGVQIVCLADGSLLGSVPRPDPASVGLPPSVVVTNAVSVAGRLMFISNGEAGVYLAAGWADFEDRGCARQEVKVLGHLRFGTRESVNHVSFNGNTLLVAAGLGGVKVVRVQDRGRGGRGGGPP